MKIGYFLSSEEHGPRTLVDQTQQHLVETGHGFGIAGRRVHPERERLQRAAEHPAGMRIQLGADRAAQRLDVFHEGL